MPVFAADGAAAFTDVSNKHPAYQAITYLHDKGLIAGYPDGTFKPNQQVDRAAAIKMVLAGKVTDADAKALANPGYSDVAKDAWYAGYAAKAVQLGIIDGPSASPAFNGGRPVILAEFLKVLELAQGMDPKSYGEIMLPFAGDVTDAKAWYYPYVRLGMASSLLQVDAQGLLHPDKKLTRGDVAQYVYYLLMYKESRRTQALLSLAETELSGNVIPNLSAQGLQSAKMAHTRALLAARGALASRPDAAIVKGAVKVTEGFGAIVDAYDAGVGGRPDDVLTATGKAWKLAEEAKSFSPSLAEIAGQMEQIAHNMAEEARSLKAK